MIIERLRCGGHYFEPFVGGGAVFFALSPISPSLTDANAALVNAYLAVQQYPREVITFLEPLQNCREHYDFVRRNNFSVGSSAQRAAEFIFCNRTSFNGLFRVNLRGQFNTPFGKNPRATVCDKENLLAASRALRGVELGACDFEVAVEDALPGDTVYFDPPYAPMSKTSDFTSYTAHGFGADDQRRLRDVAAKLKARGVRVVLSNSRTPIVEELYAGWSFEVVSARRAINSKSNCRGPVEELLIF